MTGSVDMILSIYQGGSSSAIKTLTGKTPQEVREVLEQLIKNIDPQATSTSSSVPFTQEEQRKETNETNDVQSSNRSVTEYPVQFDTRNQSIPLEQIMQDTTFLSIDSNNQQTQENNRDQSPDPNQYLPTLTVLNSSKQMLSLLTV